MNQEHRKADILAQILQANLRDLIANLASTMEANAKLQAKVAELEQKLSPQPTIEGEHGPGV